MRSASLLTVALACGCSAPPTGTDGAAAPREAAPAPAPREHGDDTTHARAGQNVIGLWPILDGRCFPRAVAPPRFVAELASFDLSEGYSAELVRRILVRHVGELALCAEQAGLPKSDASHEVRLRITVAAEGVVRAAHADASRPALAKGARCLATRMRSWRFPPSELGLRTNVTAVLRLGPRPAERVPGPADCDGTLH